MFGDVTLTGVFRQKVDSFGELWYKGVMHFFGTQLPIQVILKPSKKALKGEKLYYAFTYLPAQKYEAKNARYRAAQWQMVRNRANAEKKVKKILETIGALYVYKKNKIVQPTPEICKRCIRKSRRGYIKRQKKVSKRKVQRVSSAGKRNIKNLHRNRVD